MQLQRIICVFCVVFSSLHAAVDLDNDGFSDIWRLKYPGASLLPSDDTDGDGQKNLDEAISGTNPYAAQDIIRVTQLQRVGLDIEITWPSLAGKIYGVESSASLGTDAWIPLGAVVEGTDSPITSRHPGSATTSFFRVRVLDTDTDADGITDWEEIQVGYNPNVNEVRVCSCIVAPGGSANPACGGNDLTRLTRALQSPSVITLTATDSNASEPPLVGELNLATFRVKRSGGLASFSVVLTRSGTASADDHAALPSVVSFPLGATEVMVTVTPLADLFVESPETVHIGVSAGEGYTLGAETEATAMIHDQIQPNGTGLLGTYWKHPNNNANSPDFSTVPKIVRVDPAVDFNNAPAGAPAAPWPGSPITEGTNSNYFSSRWIGEILPEFSQYYTIFANTNEAGRVWINGKLVINKWPPATVSSSEQSAIVFLEAGKRHPIVFEHFNNTGGHVAILSWQSASQPKQVIPQARLFPNAPPQIYGPYEAWAFVGAPLFSYQINASGSPTSYLASPLPAGFTLSSTGIISGNPTAPGVYPITLTATNTSGSGSATLLLNVLQAGSGITREVWSNVPGATISSIPLTTSPTSTSVLTSLTAPSDQAEDYGVRIRGFLTAPVSGEYRFFLRADESAQFSLSNDDEPVNLWKRAELSAPSPATGWAGAAASPLLYLEAGRKYYLEILHKEASGADHLALGWSKPGENDSTASEIVPGHLLTRYENAASAAPLDGTLHFAQLLPQSGVMTNASGTSSIQLSEDRQTAWIKPNYANLGSAFTGMHVHDSRLPSTANIVFDLDEPGVQILADGSYVWEIVGVGALSATEIADGIGQSAYFNVHSQVYPNGEIKGYYRKVDGSATFTAPSEPPSWSLESSASNSNPRAAARFLQQATFGANQAEIVSLQAQPSYEAWIDTQFTKPITYHFPYVQKFRNLTTPNNSTYPGSLTFNSWWKNSIEADDQLRQRIAFALSEIMVISENGPLDDRADAISDYYDLLLDHAFGNARDLLEAVTLHPAMGRYLDMLRNDKPNLATGLIPNENYAREILQLFSLGLNRMHPDGSLLINSKGLPVPVYDQDAIIGLAHGFTGWDYHYTGAYRTSLGASANWVNPMREVPSRHYIGKKRILNNVVLPGLANAAGAPIDPYATHTTTQTSDLAYQALPMQELDAIHDQIFRHPNFGPFLCHQLIQRLVTSSPSRAYIYRVTRRFNDNGFGIRGDMKAVVQAILLDSEARSITTADAPTYGKQIEPIVRVTQLARAFRPANNFAGTYTQDGGIITIDTGSTAHRLSPNQKVLLGFTSAGLPSADGDYSVLAVAGNTFTVRARHCIRTTWVSSAVTPPTVPPSSLLTLVAPFSHGFTAGQSVFLSFRDLPAGSNRIYQIASVPSDTTLTIVAAVPLGSGTCDISSVRGIYTQRTVNSIATLTLNLSTITGLAPNSKITLHFTPVTGETTIPPNGIYTISAFDPTDPNRLTVTPDVGALPVTTSTLSGSLLLASSEILLSRSGTAISGYSDWNVGETDTALGQTPMRSPTVFNYFQPDYRHPGLLATSGLVTPEFQISSETNVIRQTNFLFGGIYSSSNSLTAGYTNGFTSFRDGGHDLTMDFSPWMGARTVGTDYCTNTANLRPLILELSNILMAGRMSTAMEDKIYTFVSNTTNIAYSSTVPTEAERRNRLRSIIYLIAVSPEFAIQR